MMDPKSNKYFFILLALTKLCYIGVLGLCVRVVFVKVFKNYYCMEVALSAEGVTVAVVTISTLCVVLITTSLFWPENEIAKFVADCSYKLILLTLLMILCTSLVAVAMCGLIQDTVTVVGTWGVFTLYKTYWTNSQLLRYCTNEFQSLGINQKLLRVDVKKVVMRAENSLDECKALLAEAIAKAKLAREVRQGVDRSYWAWARWLLGLKKDKDASIWRPGMWTGALLTTVILSTLGHLIEPFANK